MVVEIRADVVIREVIQSNLLINADLLVKTGAETPQKQENATL